MLKKIYNVLVSTYTMAVLFVVFAVSMAVATFIESKYGTETARALVYEAWWFEGIMVLGAVNLIGNIIRYRLFSREKWHSFVFHTAFLLILTGAAVTRYLGYEGQMPIREGEMSNVLLSEKNYLMLRVDDGDTMKLPVYKRMLLSALGKNDFRLHTDFKGKPIEVRLTDFIPHARKVFEHDKEAPLHLQLVESTTGSRKTHFIRSGRGLLLNGVYISFNDTVNGAIQIFKGKDGGLWLRSKIPGTYRVMTTGEQGQVPADSTVAFHLRALYDFDGIRFVVPEAPGGGRIRYIPGNPQENPWNVIRLKVKAGDEEKEVELLGGQYYEGNPKIFQLGGLNFVMFYGPKRIPLPFSVKLRDFQVTYYPGSNSPSSFASEVTVVDKDTVFDYRIYMNHVLDYKGYRFFQASYRITPEYEQTILSVNHDFWGTWITYVGYALLYFGLLMIFVNPHSLYNRIRRHFEYIRKKRMELGLVFLLFVALPGYGQVAEEQAGSMPAHDVSSPEALKKMLPPTVAPDSVAEQFGRLIIQDYGGRLKPVNTYASELLRKLSKHDTYKVPDTAMEITADQALLSMVIAPHFWAYAPVIYLERGDTQLREILGLPEDVKYARLADFFDGNGNYKLASYVDRANKSRIKSKFEKDILNVDRRVNLLYGTLMGNNIRLFPLPGDPNHKWYSYTRAAEAGFKGNDSLFVAGIMTLVANSIISKHYEDTRQFIKGIADFQKRFGADVLPDPEKVKWEIFYNKYDAFRSMFWQLMLVSLFLLMLIIVDIVRPNKVVRWLIGAVKVIVILMFLWMVFFLGLRWYISGHAPWSNAYESIIYVALATLGFGIWFGRKSELTLASTAFIASILLMVAHWSWMDPAIENLQPVLNSYWLMIHVAIIVASYGPFILSAMLAFLTLMFIIFTTEKNKLKFELIIKELTDINKMSLIVGLVLLTIGNFLGGQWANESWGRYWGWDPKETWALISIMIYALVIHAHMVPALRGLFKFNVMSLFAIWSIMMTYFGVNFYLAGLHSYAKGDAVQTPAGVYIALAVMFSVSLIAWFRYRKFYDKD